MSNDETYNIGSGVAMPVFPDIILADHGIDEAMAAELRIQFAAFADDWDDPARDVYNDYHAALAWLKAHEKGDSSDHESTP